METSTGGLGYVVMTIAAPIIFAVVLLFAVLNNRRSRAEKLRSEQAARDRQDAERQAKGLPPKTTPVSSDKN